MVAPAALHSLKHGHPTVTWTNSGGVLLTTSSVAEQQLLFVSFSCCAGLKFSFLLKIGCIYSGITTSRNLESLPYKMQILLATSLDFATYWEWGTAVVRERPKKRSFQPSLDARIPSTDSHFYFRRSHLQTTRHKQTPCNLRHHNTTITK